MMKRLLLTLGFLPYASFGYIFVEYRGSESAVILRGHNQVYYQTCPRSIYTESSNLEPEALLKQCQNGTGGKKPFGVPPLRYERSLMALRGVPTRMTPTLPWEEVLSELALTLESSHRGGSVSFEKIRLFEKYSTAEERVLGFLGPEKHAHIPAANRTPLQSEIVYYSMTALSPVFAGNSFTLMFGSAVSIDRTYEACQPHWQLASLENILELINNEPDSAAFVQWMREIAPTKFPGTKTVRLAVWNSYIDIQNDRTNGRLTNTFKEQYVALDLADSSIARLKAETEALKVLIAQGKQISKSQTSLQPIEEKFKETYPLVCIRRFQPQGDTVPPVVEAGEYTLQTLAGTYGTTPKQMARMLYTRPVWEQRGFGILTESGTLSRNEIDLHFAEGLAHRYGFDLPTYDIAFVPPVTPPVTVPSSPDGRPVVVASNTAQQKRERATPPALAQPAVARKIPRFKMSQQKIDEYRAVVRLIRLIEKNPSQDVVSLMSTIEAFIDEAQAQLQGGHALTVKQMDEHLNNLERFAHLDPQLSPLIQELRRMMR